MGWSGFKRSGCLLENCLFEPFLGVKSGSKPMDMCASSYSFDSKTTPLHCHTKSVVQTKLPLGRLPSHISSKANRATGGLGGTGFDHQRANGLNRLRHRVVLMRNTPRFEVENCDLKLSNSAKSESNNTVCPQINKIRLAKTCADTDSVDWFKLLGRNQEYPKRVGSDR